MFRLLHGCPFRVQSSSIPARFALSAAALALFCRCGGAPPGTGAKVYAPDDMPDICQDIDFNRAGADLKAECGVQTRNYMAYRNIPEHRNLLLPKGAKIVRKGKGLELRLVGTLPIGLPGEMDGKILFDEKLRRTFIKNKMDYSEFFRPGTTERLRIMRLDIPLDAGGSQAVCFAVGGPPTTAQRKAGYAGRLDSMDCADFQKLKALAAAQDESEEGAASPATRDSSAADGPGSGPIKESGP